MMMTSTIGVVLVLLVALLGLQNQTAAQQQEGAASMVSMMQRCRQHQESASTSIDQMLKMMEDAQQSSDPANVRQALQDAQKRMRDMRQNMSSCTEMMNQMQNMPGMMDGGTSSGMGGMMSGCPGCRMMAEMMSGGTSGMMRGGIVVLSVIAVFLGLSLVAALLALTMFLWNRSRVARTTAA
jgi:hypothetical protein